MPRVFQTTSPQGLNHKLPPMRLWEKAKKLGTWNPADINFAQDRQDWMRLSSEEKRLILHLTTLFQAGEEAVTLDLLPLIMVIAEEGRLEEEMYLTSFLFEEAKHVEAFRRFFDEVAEDSSDLSHFHTENYHHIFYEALPQALNLIIELLLLPPGQHLRLPLRQIRLHGEVRFRQIERCFVISRHLESEDSRYDHNRIEGIYRNNWRGTSP